MEMNVDFELGLDTCWGTIDSMKIKDVQLDLQLLQVMFPRGCY